MKFASEEEGAAVLGAAVAFEHALSDLLTAVQDADRDDPELVAAMRETFALPQKMAALAQNFANLMDELNKASETG